VGVHARVPLRRFRGAGPPAPSREF
jgi:hypothetical protein